MNQALMARQCWRIIKNPNSLCARLLKAIYFPRGNFLNTVFKQDAYPSWCGIEFGLELLTKGLVWRVGNSESINICRDNWVPRYYNLKVSPKQMISRVSRVDQLLTKNPSRWNEVHVPLKMSTGF
jgi:hypothetical protein